MDQNIEPKIEPEKKINKKNIIILVIVGLIVILILLGIWYWQIQKSKSVVPLKVIPQAPQAIRPAPPTAKEDSVSTVNQELNSVDLGNLDKEFQAIDSDLNSL